MRGLFERGKIGFLPGIDYPDPDLSHFHSRHFWETGLITERSAPGWLGRWLDRAGKPRQPAPGHIDGLRALAGAALGARAGGRGGLAGRRRLLDPRRVGRALRRGDEDATRGSGTDPRAARRSRASRDAVRLAKGVADRLAPVRRAATATTRSPRSIPYPAESDFGRRLRYLAAMISKPLGIRVAARGGRRRLRHARRPEGAERAARAT